MWNANESAALPRLEQVVLLDGAALPQAGDHSTNLPTASARRPGFATSLRERSSSAIVIWVTGRLNRACAAAPEPDSSQPARRRVADDEDSSAGNVRRRLRSPSADRSPRPGFDVLVGVASAV